MKKLLSIILALVLVFSLVACATETKVDETDDGKEVVETNKTEDKVSDTEEKKEEQKEEPKKEEPKKEEVKKEEPKKEEPSKKDEPSKEESKKEESKPSKPSTLGTTLLSDFKEKAASGMGVQEIADALITSSYIKFGGGAMPVEEGYLSGFDNAEIKGFKSGVMIAPMIGSIPFVGYVFELENASEVASFVSNLEKNANKRWNICVEADEMVTGSVGNKVFFVMCPASLEE